MSEHFKKLFDSIFLSDWTTMVTLVVHVNTTSVVSWEFQI